MKRKFKLLLLNLIFITLLQNFSFAEENKNLINDERYACNLFYQNVEKSDNPRVRNFFSYFEENGFGFSPDYEFDEKKNQWSLYTDGTKTRVGFNYNHETAKVLKPGDIIVKINGIDPSTIIENNWWNYIENEDEVKELALDIINKKGESKSIILKRSLDDYGNLFHSVRELKIIDIDLKKSTFTTYIENSYENRYDVYFYQDDRVHPLVDIANKSLYYKTKSGDYNFHICNPDSKYFDDKILPDPAGVYYPNVVENDVDLERIENKIWLYSIFEGRDQDQLTIQRIFKNNFKILNEFNLRSFPFDRQTLKIKIVDNEYSIDTRVFEISPFSYRALDEYLSKDDIPGWSKISAKVSNTDESRITNTGIFWSGILIELELERKHGYYIFKVILPMLLILMVCWSVVWVDPKELEARLTITIVCLLSLIAYNFVIDSELPKLEYLTVLDWIILISYVYATIPNFLSVISFRVQKTDIKLSNRLELLSRKYGLSSYILSILFIIWLNAFVNPDNTSALISWMVGK